MNCRTGFAHQARLVILALAVSQATWAQSLSWVTGAGGGGTDAASGVAVGPTGDIWVTGSFEGQAIFGGGEAGETALSAAHSFDIFAARYESDGTLRWAVGAGGQDLDQGFDIAIDDSGNSYVIGLFESTLTFGASESTETTLTSTGSRDMFLAKLDPGGGLRWVVQAGSVVSNDHATGIRLDRNGNIYLAGFYNDSTVFAGRGANRLVLRGSGGFDAFLAKFASDGDVLWAKTAGGPGFDAGLAVDLQDPNRIYLAGYFEGTAVFGQGETNETTLTSAGNRDLFLSCFDSLGALHWTVQAGGTSSDEAFDLAVDPNGRIFLTGSFLDQATFGAGEPNETTLTSGGSTDMFVAQFDSAGMLAWVRGAGGSESAQGFGIACDAGGNSYVTGNFDGLARFGVGEQAEAALRSGGGTDIFVAHYQNDGRLGWARHAGGFGSEFAGGIALDASANVYITGIFDESAFFAVNEPNQTRLTGAGRDDMYLAAYTADQQTSAGSPRPVPSGFVLEQNFPNPFNPSTTIRFRLPQAGQITLRILDTLGREVMVLADAHLRAGMHSFNWDALGAASRPVPSGVYIYVLDAAGWKQQKKLVLIR